MVSVVRRMRFMHARLVTIRNGLGAAILPKQVRRIKLEFNYKNVDGHMGSRKFWQTELPRLQFHNPDVKMDVVRSHETGGPATLSIYHSNQDTPAQTIDMRYRQHEDIARELIATTGAVEQLTPTSDLPMIKEAQKILVDKIRVGKKELKERQSRKANLALKMRSTQVVDDL